MRTPTSRFIVASIPFLFMFERSWAASQLLWSDEFDTAGFNAVDPSVWSHDIGDWGWGNGEFQNYTTDNSYVQNGLLHIECRRDGDSFTSARIKTESQLNVRYGRIQARIKLPNVENGLWPAFWTLGQDFSEISWPFAGEIDIMEVGQADGIVDGVVNRRVSSSIHYSNDADNGSHKHETGSIDTDFAFHQDFHVYQLDWTPNYARFTIDDQLIYEADISNSCNGTCTELHTPHFLILNVAVGGGYTYVEGEPWGPERITASTPAVMQVDYVRIYQNGFAQLSGPAAPVAEPNELLTAPSPPPTNEPTGLEVNEAFCSNHAGCASLQGECCPSPEGLFLSCCNAKPSPLSPITSRTKKQCSANSQCGGLGLQGACCPTQSSGAPLFLDCCDAIPTACGNDGEECIVYSAIQFLQEQSGVRDILNGSKAYLVSLVLLLTVWCLV